MAISTANHIYFQNQIICNIVTIKVVILSSMSLFIGMIVNLTQKLTDRLALKIYKRQDLIQIRSYYILEAI